MVRQAVHSADMYETASVNVRVNDVTPTPGKGKVLALASVEIDVAGVTFFLHGVQVVRSKDPNTGGEAVGVDLPRYRSPAGSWKQALTLPNELRRPIAHAVLDECCDLGITRRKARSAALGKVKNVSEPGRF